MNMLASEALPVQPRRRAFALALYFSAVLGALGTLMMLMLAHASYVRHKADGDFTGANMALSFTFFTLTPLTLIALLLALWLWPVSGWLARTSSISAARAPSTAGRRLQRAGMVALALVGVGLLATAIFFVVYGVTGGYRDSGLRGFKLVALAVQDLIWFSPLLVLSGLAFLFVVTIARALRTP